MKRVIIGLLLVLMGCELIVDVDIPEEPSRITVNCLFNPDSTWRATLTASSFILRGYPYVPIQNARVIIYDGEHPIDTLAYAGSDYRSDKSPAEGQSYSIRVEATGFESVFATSVVPTYTPDVSTELKEQVDAEGLETVLTVTFYDNPSEENYYELLVFGTADRFFWYSSDSIYTTTFPIPVEVKSPFFREQLINNIGSGLLFRDSFFDDPTIQIELTTYYNLSNLAEMQVVVRNVTQEYYRYNSTLALQYDSDGNPFAQSVSVYNNIENGFGIFAGHNQGGTTHATPAPIVTSISPMQGRPGDTITITGENLPTYDYGGYVAFSTPNGHATVSTFEHTGQSLKVVVPSYAADGPIYVANNGRIIRSENDFEILD